MKISIISYNIWFDNENIKERFESLCSTLFLLDADIVCLQEVLPEIYTILIEKLKYNYEYITPFETNKRYGLVILSKYLIKKTIIENFRNTNMDRYLLCAYIDIPYEIKDKYGICIENYSLLITNTHFESVFNNNTKYMQYKEAEEYLNNIFEKEKTNIILCCDANVKKEEEKYFFTENWKDTWQQKGDNKNKFTYDFITNENIRLKIRSRIDRIIYRGNLNATEFYLHRGIEGFIKPSDHHGLYAEIELN